MADKNKSAVAYPSFYQVGGIIVEGHDHYRDGDREYVVEDRGIEFGRSKLNRWTINGKEVLIYEGHGGQRIRYVHYVEGAQAWCDSTHEDPYYNVEELLFRVDEVEGGWYMDTAIIGSHRWNAKETLMFVFDDDTETEHLTLAEVGAMARKFFMEVL